MKGATGAAQWSHGSCFLKVNPSFNWFHFFNLQLMNVFQASCYWPLTFINQNKEDKSKWIWTTGWGEPSLSLLKWGALSRTTRRLRSDEHVSVCFSHLPSQPPGRHHNPRRGRNDVWRLPFPLRITRGDAGAGPGDKPLNERNLRGRVHAPNASIFHEAGKHTCLHFKARPTSRNPPGAHTLLHMPKNTQLGL